MAKATITFEDQGKKMNISVKFAPVVKKGGKPTYAQHCALLLVEELMKPTNATAAAVIAKNFNSVKKRGAG